MALYLLELDDSLTDYYCYHRILVRASDEKQARKIAADYAVADNAFFGNDGGPRGWEVEHGASLKKANFRYTDMYGNEEICYNPWLDRKASTCSIVEQDGDSNVIIYDYLHG